MDDDVSTFEAHRPALLSLAYRMLGEVARAEDVVQDAWLRWQARRERDVETPRAFLLTTVTRLCLDELGSSKRQREEPRGDALPEPFAMGDDGFARFETLDRMSMAFLVVLQRLTPAERAVFLLHDVFDMEHADIAERLGRSEEACRQLLSRARAHVTNEKRLLETSREEHERLLRAFVLAAMRGDTSTLETILAEDAVLVADGGKAGQRFGRLKSATRPVVGARAIVSMLSAFASEQPQDRLTIEERTLNGELAIVAFEGEKPRSAIFIAASEGRIHRVYLHLDPERLRGLRREAQQGGPS